MVSQSHLILGFRRSVLKYLEKWLEKENQFYIMSGFIKIRTYKIIFLTRES